MWPRKGPLTQNIADLAVVLLVTGPLGGVTLFLVLMVIEKYSKNSAKRG